MNQFSELNQKLLMHINSFDFDRSEVNVHKIRDVDSKSSNQSSDVPTLLNGMNSQIIQIN